MRKSGRGLRRRLFTIMAIMTAAASLGSCSKAHRSESALQSGPPQWGPARYTARETYDNGHLIMDPDPNTPTHMSQAKALAAANANPVFGSATNGRTPQVRYGLFTNNATGAPD